MRTLLLILTLPIATVLVGCDNRPAATGPSGQTMNPPETGRLESVAKIRPADFSTGNGIAEAVAFSPDGSMLALGTEGAIRIIDTSNAQGRQQLKGIPSYIRSVRFSPDGKMLAAGGIEGTVKLWDLSTGKEVRSIKCDGEVKTVAFLDHGATLLIGGWGGGYPAKIFTKAWDVGSGRELFTVRYRGHPIPDGGEEWSEKVDTLAISPDGKRLASAPEGTRDLNVRVWDLRGGQPLRQLGITAPIHGLHYSQEGNLAGGEEGGYGKRPAVHVWDPAGRSLGTFGAHDEPLSAAVFSPDGKLVAGVGLHHLDIWDIASGKLDRTVTLEMGNLRAAAFSPDQKFIAFADNLSKAHLRVLDAAPVAANPAGTAGAAAVIAFPEGEQPIDCIAFSPDGKTVAAGSEDRVIRLWDVASRRLVLTMEGQRGVPCWLEFSPDGKRLACAGADTVGALAGGVEPPNAVRMWDVSTGQALGYVTTQPQIFPAVRFLPDGKSFILADPDGVVRTFDTVTLQPKDGVAINLHGDKIGALAVAHDGKRLAIAAQSQPPHVKLVVCEASTGRDLFRAEVTPFIRRLEFSPDDQWLLCISGNPQVFDTKTGRHVATLRHRYYAQGGAFSPDGKRIASGGDDGTLKLWSVGSWQQQAELPGDAHQAYRAIAFSPDGKLIAAAQTRQLVLWRHP